ncbi:hypothetical protein [Mesorhizobium huakuii]|uniref:DUF4345 domain-containing protein n=1 Tax=Mesorhizobium huakuii TaxID=28104 RepID=A0ABZ0VM60_9HYPH|nr:hypothetical protein [Mesorhizobium huakuii]WQB98510.1 hypothetical protein U0R22_002663 [Mesorhizobium huakuii]
MEQNSVAKPPNRRSTGVIVVGIFAVIAGLGEVVVGFTGNYLGILSNSMTPSFSTGVVGLFYSLGGFFLLITRMKWGAVLAISFIGAEILGRIYLIAIGIAPGKGFDAVKILVGGLIALGLIIYILFKWRSFD